MYGGLFEARKKIASKIPRGSFCFFFFHLKLLLHTSKSREAENQEAVYHISLVILEVK